MSNLEDHPYVKSVEGFKPNKAGNVLLPNITSRLDDAVQFVNWHAPDDAGNVDVTAEMIGAASNEDLTIINKNLGTVSDVATNTQNALNNHIKQKSTSSTLGHVKVDNNTILIDSDGVISAVPVSPTLNFNEVIKEGINMERGEKVTYTLDSKTTIHGVNIQWTKGGGGGRFKLFWRPKGGQEQAMCTINSIENKEIFIPLHDFGGEGEIVIESINVDLWSCMIIADTKGQRFKKSA